MTDTMTEDALFELLSLGCRVDAIGTVRYYNSLGRLHREHGPAVEHTSGKHEWWQNGLLHRLDGPAVELVDGSCKWYINGKALTEAAWQKAVASMENV